MDEGGEAERRTPVLEELGDEDQRTEVRDSQGDQTERRKPQHTLDFSLFTWRNFTARMNMKRLFLDLKIPARVPGSRGTVPHIPHRSDSPPAVLLSALSCTSLRSGVLLFISLDHSACPAIQERIVTNGKVKKKRTLSYRMKRACTHCTPIFEDSWWESGLCTWKLWFESTDGPQNIISSIFLLLVILTSILHPGFPR